MAVLSRRAGEGQRQQVERSFLQATEGLLAAGASYAELSVGRIAEAAGKTRTAFYFYFRDKRDLLVRLTESVALELYGQADRWWSGSGAEEDLRAALAEILATFREHAPLLRAVVEASSYDEEISATWRLLVGRFIEASERRLARDTRLEPAAVHATAFSLVWMTERALYQHVVRAGDIEDDALVAALAGVWYSTLAADRS